MVLDLPLPFAFAVVDGLDGLALVGLWVDEATGGAIVDGLFVVDLYFSTVLDFELVFSDVSDVDFFELTLVPVAFDSSVDSLSSEPCALAFL